MISNAITRRFSRRDFLLMTLIGLGVTGPAGAQTFPSNVIRIVVPPGPGSPPDIISRVLASELSEREGWRVVVENRPGAMQTIAMADVLKQPTDGYSLLAMSVPVMAAPALLPKMGLRPEVDFAPIIKLSTSYNVLVVTPSLPVKSVSELVGLLKNEPDGLNFSSGGFGTPAHLIGEMFKLQTGVRAIHVPSQQLQQRMVDLLNGVTQFDFITTVAVVDLIATGKLRALAVTAPRRVAAFTDVPTVVEQGFPDLVVEDWVGLAARSGTPAEIITLLNHAIGKALASPKVRQGFANGGAEPAGGTPAEFGQFISSQVTHWGNVVKQSGIKMPQ